MLTTNQDTSTIYACAAAPIVEAALAMLFLPRAERLAQQAERARSH
ncbi:MAG: hypothetical protein ACREE0_16590 [Phenylobacterium sp.]